MQLFRRCASFHFSPLYFGRLRLRVTFALYTATDRTRCLFSRSSCQTQIVKLSWQLERKSNHQRRIEKVDWKCFEKREFFLRQWRRGWSINVRFLGVLVSDVAGLEIFFTIYTRIRLFTKINNHRSNRHWISNQQVEMLIRPLFVTSA